MGVSASGSLLARAPWRACQHVPFLRIGSFRREREWCVRCGVCGDQSVGAPSLPTHHGDHHNIIIISLCAVGSFVCRCCLFMIYLLSRQHHRRVYYRRGHAIFTARCYYRHTNSTSAATTTTTTTTTATTTPTTTTIMPRLRVWVRFVGGMTEDSAFAKALRFDDSIPFAALIQKIVAKLDIAPIATSAAAQFDATQWQLFLDNGCVSEDDEDSEQAAGACIVEDTDEIDHNDKLVLKRRRQSRGDANVVSSQEEEESGSNSNSEKNGGGGGDSGRREEEGHDDDDDDDSEIEDVTEQYLRDKKRQRREKAAEAEDLCDDDDGDDDEAEATDSEDDDDEEEEFEFDDDEDEEDDDSEDEDWCEDDEETETTTRKRKKAAAKVPDPPLQVLMEEKDVPAAPGKRDGKEDGAEEDDDENNGMDEIATLKGGRRGGVADRVTKDRIIKLLNTGFHATSNEHEAKNAMKLAQRLMRKHNLSQAILLQERDDAAKNETAAGEGVLKGGMVKVRIVNRNTGNPAQMARWILSLTHPIGENFSVESFSQVQRGRKCSVTFYGIYTNAQLAAYAFRVATERISQMAAEHRPTASRQQHRKISTKSSRLSYALGVVKGISDEVDATFARERERERRRLERVRHAASTGEAYEESDAEQGFDDDDDDDDHDNNDGPGYSFPERKNCATDSDKPCTSDVASMSKPTPLAGDSLDRRLEELEREEQAALVLVDHREKIAKQVLSDNKIKLSSGKKHAPITFDRHSYDKGIVDSKEIDINQRAIRDEVRVKKEEKKKKSKN